MEKNIISILETYNIYFHFNAKFIKIFRIFLNWDIEDFLNILDPDILFINISELLLLKILLNLLYLFLFFILELYKFIYHFYIFFNFSNI